MYKKIDYPENWRETAEKNGWPTTARGIKPLKSGRVILPTSPAFRLYLTYTTKEMDAKRAAREEFNKHRTSARKIVFSLRRNH